MILWERSSMNLYRLAMLDILLGGVYRIAIFGRGMAERGQWSRTVNAVAYKAILGPKKTGLQS